jgi:hypothetical protein
MAIYHFSAQMISRGRGQSAVAAASYRSGDRLTDERTGEEKYYHRDVEPDTMILAPSHSPEWVKDRGQLWNSVEQIEKRKDAQLAREINIALPIELSKDQQSELICDYIQKEFVDKGMIADIAIHRDDLNNPHAHVMLTTRKITIDGFGPKNRDWNNKELLNQWREQWADYANKALEKEGIQEHISHLSHEARGLEQMPTIHLGHIAHEMESKNVQSDRGNINRERQEYNRLVVDLQKYREEKQALEEEKVRKQVERQKVERFSTAAERVDLQKAFKLLKTEPTLSKIVERRKQIDKWEDQVHNNDQYLRWKDEKVREASNHYQAIHSFEGKIQEAEQRIENINWLNPLKIKENLKIKEQTEQDISKAQDQIKFYDEKLNYHREKLRFSNEQEFTQVRNQHETDLPGLLEKNQSIRQQIRYERDVLQKADNAHKNAFVRQIASLYPERPEMHHISFETAQKLVKINKANNKVVPIENIEKVLNNHKQEIQRLQGEITRVDLNQSRLRRAEGYLENYEKYETIVKKYEDNPFLKGKMLVSKLAKKEYENAVSTRDSYQDLIKKEEVSGRTDFKNQIDALGKMEARIPEFKGQIQSQEKGMGILDAVMKGIEQAGREMQKEQQLQHQKAKGKRKKHQHDWEIGR